MTNEKFHVDVSPEMQLYKILQRQSYDIGTALAEFVDNSIQSFRDQINAIRAVDGPDPHLKIRIVISSEQNQIVIEDNAGGINRENFQRAIRMGYGEQTEPATESLSVYGIGMKSSAIWFSNRWSIETSAMGTAEKLTTTFDLEELLETGNSKIEVAPTEEEVRKHYTRITIRDCLRDLKDSNKQFENSVLPYLKETFFKFENVFIEIEHDNLLLQTDKAYLDEPLPLKYPRVDKNGNKLSDEPVTWRRKLDFVHEGKNVKGFIMIMQRGSYGAPGIRLLRNQRVIHGTSGGERQNKPQILLGTSNKYAPQRIYGEIKLHEFPVNFMKTGFDINMDSLYRAIRKQISASPPEVMDDFIQQAESYRVKKSGSSGGRKKKQKAEDKIPFSEEINNKLEALAFKKLYRLYQSLCRISLSKDPVLSYVGAWVLLESLATQMGKHSNTAFTAFYSNKLGDYAKTHEKSSGQKNEIKTTIGDIHAKGNMNKHSDKYETMNAQQLAVDFPTIEGFLIYCVDLELQDTELPLS